MCDSTAASETLTIQLSEGITEDMLSETVYILVSSRTIYIAICDNIFCFQNDQINNINTAAVGKRQISNTPDFCEPRFIATTAPSVFQLVWGCPNGTDPPNTMDILAFICTSLIGANIVDSCTYPGGITQLPPVPPPLEPIV